MSIKLPELVKAIKNKNNGNNQMGCLDWKWLHYLVSRGVRFNDFRIVYRITNKFISDII